MKIVIIGVLLMLVGVVGIACVSTSTAQAQQDTSIRQQEGTVLSVSPRLYTVKVKPDSAATYYVFCEETCVVLQ